MTQTQQTATYTNLKYWTFIRRETSWHKRITLRY